MRIFKTLPKHGRFHSFYAPLIPSLNVASYFAQAISAGTGFFILYSILRDNLSQITAEPKPWALAGAVAGVLFIELALRKLLPILTRSIIKRQFKGVAFFMFFPILILTAGLCYSSYFLSFYGSIDVVDIYTPPVETIALNSIDEMHRAEADTIWSRHRISAEAISAAAAGRHRAVTELYAAKIAAAKKEKRRYLKLYADDHAWAKASAEAQESRIGQLITAQAGAAAEVETEKRSDLSALQSITDGQLAGVDKRRQADRDEARSQNKTLAERRDKFTGRWGFGLAWFSLACLIFLIFAIAIGEIYRHGSGIEIEARPEPHTQTIWNELSAGVTARLSDFVRCQVRRLSDFEPKAKPKQIPNFEAVTTPDERRRSIGFRKQKEAATEPENLVMTKNYAVIEDAETIRQALKTARVNYNSYAYKLRHGIGKKETNEAGLERWEARIDEYLKRL